MGNRARDGEIMVDFATARRNMVENQVRTNKVTDPVLIAAMAETPRELFVPRGLRGVAYVDEDIAVAPGRYLMEPMVVARLLQLAEVQPTDIALDIGCATGYSTALLARLCDTVVGVESDHDLAARATAVLADLGVDNAAVVEGRLTEGYPKQAPYDVILFSGAVSEVPGSIARQLAEGGRIVAVIDRGTGVGRGTVFTLKGGVLSGREVFDAATPLLPEFEPQPGFVFEGA